MSTEEISGGGGYPRREVTWTSVTVAGSCQRLVEAQEEAEKQAILDVLRKIEEGLRPGPGSGVP